MKHWRLSIVAAFVAVVWPDIFLWLGLFLVVGFVEGFFLHLFLPVVKRWLNRASCNYCGWPFKADEMETFDDRLYCKACYCFVKSQARREEAEEKSRLIFGGAFHQ